MTDSEDDLTALRDRVPQARVLPHQPAHRAGLLVVLSAEPAAQLLRPGRRAMRRWLSPVAAAVAVAAIAFAVTLPNLLGSTAAPGAGAHTKPPGHGVSRAGLRWQVPITGLHAVTVRTSAGAVTVKAAHPGTDVAVSATRHFSGKAPAVSSKVVAGVLEVSGRCPRSDHRCAVSFVVRLPRALPVQVNDDLGTVRLAGLSGPVTVTDALGDIEGFGLTSPRVSLTNDLGNISVAFAAPPAHVVATDQDGNVTVKVPTTTAYQVTAQTELGTTTVSVPTSRSAAHVIKTSSQLGNVTVTG